MKHPLSWTRLPAPLFGAGLSDRAFSFLIRASAWAFIALFALMAAVIFVRAWPAMARFGPGFFISPAWDSWKGEFGALSFVYGTVASSLLALLLAVPASLALALFLTEMAPPWLSRPLGFVVEMLAAIPSIIYGLWGVFVLAPFLRGEIQPFLSSRFGGFPLFSGPFYGIGMMCAGIILAIMITPTVSSICKEIFRAVPAVNKEGGFKPGNNPLGDAENRGFKGKLFWNCRGGGFGLWKGFWRNHGGHYGYRKQSGHKPLAFFSGANHGKPSGHTV